MVASVPSVDDLTVFWASAVSIRDSARLFFPVSQRKQQEACRRWRFGRGGQIALKLALRPVGGGARGLLPHASIQGSLDHAWVCITWMAASSPCQQARRSLSPLSHLERIRASS